MKIIKTAVGQMPIFLYLLGITPIAMAQNIFFDRGTQVMEAAYLFRTQSKTMACDLEQATADDNNSKNMLVCERFKPTYLILKLTADKAPEVLSEGRDVGGDRMKDPILLDGTWWVNNDFGCLSEKTGLTCKNKAGYGFFLTSTRFKQLEFSKH